jgi:hypothetical protein
MAQMLRTLGMPDTTVPADALRLGDLGRKDPLQRLRREPMHMLRDPYEAYGGMPEHLRGEIRPYEPSWRDSIANWMLGDGRPTLGREQVVRGLMGSTGLGTQLGLVDFVPVVGQGLDIQEAVRKGDSEDVRLALMPGGAPLKRIGKPVLKLGEVGTGELAKLPARLYNSVVKPARTLEAAPPNGARAVEHRRDIEGRPLAAGYVGGRRMVGGHDEALSAEELNALSERAFGTRPTAVAPREIREDAGRRVDAVDPRTGQPAAPEVLASRQVWIHDPPPKPPRPFEADYPNGAKADEQGRLLEDIEGRPLTAEYVVGRRSVGAGDEAFPEEELDAFSERAFGTHPTPVASREMGGSAGRFVTTTDLRSGLAEYGILVDKALTPGPFRRVLGHEVGHGIDKLAGGIPVKGHVNELKQVYDTLLTGRERRRNLTLPGNVGYKGAEVDREYIAEAIRAYMRDPNYLKTVAPKTAAKIRAAVNGHPTLSRIIQFNTLGGLGLLGTQAGDPERRPPPLPTGER